MAKAAATVWVALAVSLCGLLPGGSAAAKPDEATPPAYDVDRSTTLEGVPSSVKDIGIFILDPDGAPNTAPTSVWRGKPLLTLALRAEHAVRISQTIEGFKLRIAGRLVAGQVLASPPGWPHIFCPALDGRTLCLRDYQNDGVFEGGLNAAGAADRYSLVLLPDVKGRLQGAFLSGLKPLIEPIRYEPVDYRLGPAGQATLRWQSDYEPEKNGHPVIVSLWLEAGYAVYPGIRSTPQTFTLPNGTGRIQFQGMTIEVLGFETGGRIHYRILDITPSQKVQFFA